MEIDDVVRIHEVLIDRFGGTKGVRDMGLLQSAISRPFQTFENKELYPSLSLQSAALIESLLINHPFIDGNKRIGYVLMRLHLLQHGHDIIATQDEKLEFVLSIAEGQIRFEKITEWIDQRKIEIIRSE